MPQLPLFNEYAIVALTFLVFLVTTEIAFRVGHSRRTSADDSDRSHISSMQGALLGLLALLLGFTFSMSVSRFDTRKELVLAEGNAIQTTYLRAQLLPGEIFPRVAAILHAYLVARLDFYNAGEDPEKLRAADATTERIHHQLWQVAADASKSAPQSNAVTLFAQSVNEVITLHNQRLRALDNHVPDLVLYLVILVAATALGFVGFGRGLQSRRHFRSTGTVALLLALVIGVIIDLDRPRAGLIRNNQESIRRLQETLK